MTLGNPTTVTRRQYEDLRARQLRRRAAVLAALKKARADSDEWARLWTELATCTVLPALPKPYIFLLFEPDGTYMGATRSRDEIRQLRSDGLEFTVQKAVDLHPEARPVPPKFQKLMAGADHE